MDDHGMQEILWRAAEGNEFDHRVACTIYPREVGVILATVVHADDDVIEVMCLFGTRIGWTTQKRVTRA